MNLTNAYSIICYAAQANIQLRVENNKLIVNAPKNLVSSELQNCLLKHKQELLEILTYHGFSLGELKQYGGGDWDDIKDNQAALIAFAEILYEQKLMSAGQVPPRFTATTFCISCNKNVKVTPALTNGGRVLGCPWCHIRNNQIH